MKKRFPVARFCGAVLVVVGVLLLVSGALVAGIGLLGLVGGATERGLGGGLASMGGLAGMLSGLSTMVLGVVTAALGEGVQCLLAIEENTRDTLDYLQSLPETK